MSSGLIGSQSPVTVEQYWRGISNIDEKATPLIAMIRQGERPQSLTPWWTVDAYASPKRDSRKDGEDITEFENHADQRAKLYNYVRTTDRTAKVSPLAEEVTVNPSHERESAIAIRKKSVEANRDVEAVLMSNESAADETANSGYKIHALGSFISATEQTTFPVPAAYRPAAAQIVTSALSAFGEAELDNILQSIFDATGGTGTYTMPVGSDLKQKITTMSKYGEVTSADSGNTLIGQRTHSAEGTSISRKIDFYEGDFGAVSIFASNFIGFDATSDDTFASGVDKSFGYILDLDKLSIMDSNVQTVTELPNLGGGDRWQIKRTWTLQCLNPLGMGKLDLS